MLVTSISNQPLLTGRCSSRGGLNNRQRYTANKDPQICHIWHMMSYKIPLVYNTTQMAVYLQHCSRNIVGFDTWSFCNCICGIILISIKLLFKQNAKTEAIKLRGKNRNQCFYICLHICLKNVHWLIPKMLRKNFAGKKLVMKIIWVGIKNKLYFNAFATKCKISWGNVKFLLENTNIFIVTVCRIHTNVIPGKFYFYMKKIKCFHVCFSKFHDNLLLSII